MRKSVTKMSKHGLQSNVPWRLYRIKALTPSVLYQSAKNKKSDLVLPYVEKLLKDYDEIIYMLSVHSNIDHVRVEKCIKSLFMQNQLQSIHDYMNKICDNNPFIDKLKEDIALMWETIGKDPELYAPNILDRIMRLIFKDIPSLVYEDYDHDVYSLKTPRDVNYYRAVETVRDRMNLLIDFGVVPLTVYKSQHLAA